MRRKRINQTLIALSLILGVVPLAFAESRGIKSQSEVLKEEIRSHAQRHALNHAEMQTSLVVDLYRNNNAGLTPQEIAQTYEEAFIQTQKANLTFWERASSKLPWVISGVLFVLLIFRDLLRDALIFLLKSSGAWLYSRLAGSPSLRRLAVRQYKKALHRKYSKVHLPFRPNRPLDLHKFYVPIKLAGHEKVQAIDAYDAIGKHRRVLIKGQPGAGKSTLLKHIAFTFSAGVSTKVSANVIPVLFELHRLNNSSLSLEQHITDELGRNGFPNAARFVSHNLKRGLLVLLFDGLDEVNSDERSSVVTKINDFADTYSRSRIVVTCRTAVYRDEFLGKVEAAYDVVEFDDQQIQNFLRSWETDMPQEKSVEQLVKALRDVPRIMALARNPLLLTIIAFLYTDDPSYILPNSRAEFYEQSTDLLLRSWHKEHNKYDARAKRQVLQHLALYLQDTGKDRKQDRLSLDANVAIDEVKNLIPQLNLNKDLNPQLLIDEIVERSGLLLAIDNGSRYQFTHLTMQEFFAAVRLVDDQDGLLKRFHSDPDQWRETVKLWCGLVHDSTNAIRGIYGRDPITAFECVADAQAVEGALADQIINGFKSRLTGEDQNDLVVRAFGSVASDLGPRGQQTLKFLEQVVMTAEATSSRTAAAYALSLTSLPQAAQLLSKLYPQYSDVRSALARMGDLAVPSLSSLAQGGLIEAIDDLQVVGTPDAAKALVPMLWHHNIHWAKAASWRLASLLSNPNVEAMLNNWPQNIESTAQDHSWIWYPFNAPRQSTLPTIVSRMVTLMLASPPAELPARTLDLDPRLVIPMATILEAQEIHFDYKRGNIGKLSEVITSMSGVSAVGLIKDQQRQQEDDATIQHSIEKIVLTSIDRLSEIRRDPSAYEMQQTFVKHYYEFTDIKPRLLYLLKCLPPGLQIEVLKRLTHRRVLSRADWINVFSPSTIQFVQSSYYRVLLVLAASIHLLGVVSLIINIALGTTTFGNTPTAVTLVATTLIVVIWVTAVGWGEADFWPKGAFILVAIAGPIILCWLIFQLFLLNSFKGLSDRRIKRKLSELFFFLPALSWLPFEIYSGTRLLRNYFNLKVVWAVWLVIAITAVISWIYGKQRERESRNPLHGILEETASTV